MTTLSLKLVVDKAKNRVVFAEADKDFVDTLCSFLTLPLATVIRVLDKKSTIGCMDKIYQSVENLDTEYLLTETCKKMLLEPRSESEIVREDLKINVDDLIPTRLYKCPTYELFIKARRPYRHSISGARCPCGKLMDKRFECTRNELIKGRDKDGAFVKGGKRFIICDNVRIMPVSSVESTLSLLEKNGIKDFETVETKTVDVSRNEIIKLLGRLLVSATPLTDVFLLGLELSEGCSEGADRQPIDIIPVKSEDDSTNTASKTVRVKLLYDQVSKKVLSAQAEEDFADILFSFLTFPLGLIVKLLDKRSSVGCLDNLYKSIEFSDDGWDFIRSEERKNLLLAPKLFRHFGCGNQLLRIEDKLVEDCRSHGCEDCWIEAIAVPERMCQHIVVVESLTQVNPKLSSSGRECGEGYSMKSVGFMITSKMEVSPLSPVSVIDAIKESKATVNNVVEKEVALGKVEVLQLLKACLVSPTPLSSVFSTEKPRKIVQD